MEEQRPQSMEEQRPQSMEEQRPQSMEEQRPQSMEASQFHGGGISNCIPFNTEISLQPDFRLGSDNDQKRPPYDTLRTSRFGHNLEDLNNAVVEEKESQNGNRRKKYDGKNVVVTNEYKGSEDPCELQIGPDIAVPGEKDHAKKIVKHNLENCEFKSKDAEVKTKNEVQENVNDQPDKDRKSDEREEVYEMKIRPNTAVKLTESQAPKQAGPQVTTTGGESKVGAATDEEEMLKDFSIPRRRGRPPRRGSLTKKVPAGNRSCGTVGQRENIENGGYGKDLNKGIEKKGKGRSSGKPGNVKEELLVVFEGENENREESLNEDDFVDKKKDQSKEENASAVQGGGKQCDEGKVDGKRVESAVELVGNETIENRSVSGNNNENSDNKGKGKNRKRKEKGKDGEGTERKRSKKTTNKEKGRTSVEVQDGAVLLENLHNLTQRLGTPSPQSPGKQSCAPVGQRENMEKMQKGGNGKHLNKGNEEKGKAGTNGKSGNVKKGLLVVFEGENENREESLNEDDFVDKKKDQSKEENASSVQGGGKECDEGKVGGKRVESAVELVGKETNENRSVSSEKMSGIEVSGNTESSENNGKSKNRKRKEKGKIGEGTERKRNKKTTIKEKGRTSSKVQDGPVIVENIRFTQSLGLPSPQSPGVRNVEHPEGETDTLDGSERPGVIRGPESRSPMARTPKLAASSGPGTRSPGGSLRLGLSRRARVKPLHPVFGPS
uniref:RAD51 interacting motif domain-containing protein n=1 Tax=Eptatretus burgeri TaxID=7764 RepID=A0A8C4QDD1_EPTBU